MWHIYNKAVNRRVAVQGAIFHLSPVLLGNFLRPSLSDRYGSVGDVE